MGFKTPGSRVVLLGRLHERLAGSEYERLFGGQSLPPEPDLAAETGLIRALVDGFADGAITAAHDISHGGLLVTVCEMMLASAPFDRGCALDLEEAVSTSDELFGEFGGVVVEVPDDSWGRFESITTARGVATTILGRTTDDTRLRVRLAEGGFELTMDEIETAHGGDIAALLMG
jgi:phosphoribosylformylglycinamidine synthase